MAFKLKRFLRWTGGAFTAVLLVVFAVLLFGDLGRFRSQAEQAASEALGRQVRIAGDMRLLPMLPLTVQIEDLSIANASWAERPQLVRAGRLAVSLSLRALLDGEIRVEAVELRNLELQPERAVDGRLSWLASTDSSGAVPVLPGSVELVAGSVSYLDHGSGDTHAVELSRLELLAAPDGAELEAYWSYGGQRVETRLNADALHTLTTTPGWSFSSRSQALRWSLELTGERIADTRWHATVLAHAEDTSVLSDPLGVLLPSSGPLEATMGVQVEGATVSIDELELRSALASLTANASVDLRADRPVVQASLMVPEVNLETLLDGGESSADSELTPLLDKSLPLSLLAGLGVDLSAELEATALSHGEWRGGPLAASVNVGSTGGNLAAQLQTPAAVLALDATVLVEEGVPAIDLNLAAADINDGPLAVVQGIGIHGADDSSLQLGFTSSGVTLGEVITNLNGELGVAGVGLELARDSNDPFRFQLQAMDVSISDGVVQQANITGGYGDTPVRLQLRGEKALLGAAAEGPVRVRASADIAGFEVELEGTVASPFSAPVADMAVTWTGTDIGVLAPLAGQPTQPLFATRGRAEFEGGISDWTLKSLAAELGESRLKGQLAYTSRADTSVLAGHVHASVLNPGELAGIAGIWAEDGAGETPGSLPEAVELLLELDVDRLTGELEALADVSTRVSLQQQVLELAPLRATWSGEPVAGKARLNLGASEPGLHVELGAEDMDLGTLSQLVARHDGVTGTAASVVVTVDADGVQLQQWMHSATGQLYIDGGMLDVQTEHLSTSFEALSAELRAAPGAALTGTLSTQHAGQPVEARFQVDTLARLRADQPVQVELEVSAPEFSFSAAGTVQQPLSGEGAQLRIDSQGERLEALHAQRWLPSWMQGAFAVSTGLTYADKQLSLSSLDARVAEFELSGELRIPFDPGGRLEGELYSPVLAIPDLLEDEAEEPETDSDGYLIPSLPLGDVVAEGMSGKLDWRIDKLWLDASAFRDVELHISASEGALSVTTSGTTDETDGAYAIAFDVDPGRRPTGRLSASGQSYDFGWLLPDTGTGKPRWPVDFELSLSGPGARLDRFLGDADGEVHFIAGPTEGAEFERWDLTLLSMMLPSLSEPPRDQLSCMVLNLNVEDGVVTGDGLVAETQSLIIAGGGMIDLRSEKLGLLLTAKPRDTTLTGVTVPLKVEGTLVNPELEPASNELVLGASSLLLGVANPIALIGKLVGGANNCELALEAAREDHGVQTSVEIKSSGGLFRILRGDRDRTERRAGRDEERR